MIRLIELVHKTNFGLYIDDLCVFCIFVANVLEFAFVPRLVLFFAENFCV